MWMMGEFSRSELEQLLTAYSKRERTIEGSIGLESGRARGDYRDLARTQPPCGGTIGVRWELV